MKKRRTVVAVHECLPSASHNILAVALPRRVSSHPKSGLAAIGWKSGLSANDPIADFMLAA